MVNTLPVDIISCKPEHFEDFRKLNLEWLTAYGLVEDHDLMVLDDPQGIIIDKGGVIYLASIRNEIVGSIALIKTGNFEFELAKMSVASAYRGKGISRLLIDKCLEFAKDSGAEKIMLFSNHQLTTAISLYEKYGFRHVAVFNSPFETADVRMELLL